MDTTAGQGTRAPSDPVGPTAPGATAGSVSSSGSTRIPAQDAEAVLGAPRTEPGTVWVERVATRSLVGRTQRGASIPIGLGEGEVSPGELLKLALAGCAGMSADLSIGRRLGEDFAMRVLAHGAADEAENRYRDVREEIQLDLAGLDAEALERLRTVIEKAIEVGCTIERTVAPALTVEHALRDADGQPR